jgi:hypothetical protein
MYVPMLPTKTAWLLTTQSQRCSCRTLHTELNEFGIFKAPLAGCFMESRQAPPMRFSAVVAVGSAARFLETRRNLTLHPILHSNPTSDRMLHYHTRRPIEG